MSIIKQPFPSGLNLTRQMTGDIGWGKYNGKELGVPLESFDAIMRGTFGHYRYCGLTPAFTIEQGFYIALAFVAGVGALQLIPNPTYGPMPVVSLSTTPGDFTESIPFIAVNQDLNMVCDPNKQHAGYANLVYGATYFLNIAAAKPDSTQLCNSLPDGSRPSSCPSSTVAFYTQQGS